MSRIGRWVLWLVGVVLVLFALQLTVLAFPQVIISQSVQVGTVRIHHDGNPGIGINNLAAEVDERLRGSGFYDSSRTDRVFFCQSQGLYTLLARLAMVTPQAQGFALSVFGNSYVSNPRVTALAERYSGTPRYGIWEGSPAHIMAHEIGHLYMTDLIGRSTWMELPHWKQEGFPEYVANIALIRQDSMATLPFRIGVLNDEQVWGWSDRWDRIHYEAGLLVEFLLDIQGYSVEDIVADNVTREETLAAMMAWRQVQN
jgi:hypothetical protein